MAIRGYVARRVRILFESVNFYGAVVVREFTVVDHGVETGRMAVVVRKSHLPERLVEAVDPAGKLDARFVISVAEIALGNYAPAGIFICKAIAVDVFLFECDA